MNIEHKWSFEMNVSNCPLFIHPFIIIFLILKSDLCRTKSKGVHVQEDSTKHIPNSPRFEFKFTYSPYWMIAWVSYLTSLNMVFFILRMGIINSHHQEVLYSINVSNVYTVLPILSLSWNYYCYYTQKMITPLIKPRKNKSSQIAIQTAYKLTNTELLSRMKKYKSLEAVT